MSEIVTTKRATTESELIPEIETRWSPRAFAEKRIANEELKALFDAARWAASSMNEQPWRYIVGQKGDAHYQKLFDALAEGNQIWAKQAPVLVATIAKEHFDYKDRENRTAWHDLGLANGNLLLQATRQNISAHMMGGFDPDAIAKAFNLPPHYTAVAMVALGYFDENAIESLPEKFRDGERKSRSRKPINELVFGATFGEDYPF